jgi:hypothetical protein
MVGCLRSLVDGESAIAELVACGPAAGVPLREFLITGHIASSPALRHCRECRMAPAVPPRVTTTPGYRPPARFVRSRNADGAVAYGAAP